MTVKEFEVREMRIQAPNTSELGMLHDDLETEDNVTTEPRLLIKKDLKRFNLKRINDLENPN